MRSICLAVLLAGCSRPSDDLYLLVAASTGVAVEAAQSRWSGPPVHIATAGTAALVQQVRAGAPADVLLAANERWAAELNPLERRPLLYNHLVLVGAPGTLPPRWNTNLASELHGCLAIGDPETVPVGEYARAALRELGLWEALEPRIRPGLDAPEVAMLVARGACPVGIVYATDATGPGLVRGDAIPHTQATYPLLLLTERGRPLYDWLSSEEGLQTLLEAGFTAAPPP